MAGFAVEDMFLKAAAASVPVGQVMVIFGFGGVLCFAALALASGEALFPPAARSPSLWVRTVFEITGRLFYTLAFVLTPLSSATAILQATPIVVVAGAAMMFGETVGWRRWSAILVGLGGVLVIIRPGAEAFSPLSLLAVLGMIGFAGRDLATRAAPAGLGTYTLGVYGFAAIVVAGLGYGAWTGEGALLPDRTAMAALGGAILFGVAAYTALTHAMRTGEVSAVTPFRYTRLLFGVALGILVFGERPDAATVVGSAIVVASGLFILFRSRQS
ncbi:MAG: DMT family transporter [Pseudomonadota bacterium]